MRCARACPPDGHDRSRSSAAPAPSAAGLALRWPRAGAPVVIGSRSAERADEAAERLREARAGRRGRGPGQRGGRPARADRLPDRPVPRPVGEPQQPARGARARASSSSTAPCPLAAAVSGKATRSLGVWQGSAAQQAQEMVPDGVTVVAALHTVSAPMLADPDAELDEDVLHLRRPQGRQGAGRRAVEQIPGLRAVNAGRARDGADRRAAHAAADLDQRPLQDPRRDPDHRAARRPERWRTGAAR